MRVVSTFSELYSYSQQNSMRTKKNRFTLSTCCCHSNSSQTDVVESIQSVANEMSRFKHSVLIVAIHTHTLTRSYGCASHSRNATLACVTWCSYPCRLMVLGRLFCVLCKQHALRDDNDEPIDRLYVFTRTECLACVFLVVLCLDMSDDSHICTHQLIATNFKGNEILNEVKWIRSMYWTWK